MLIDIIADKTPAGFPVIQIQPSTRVIEIGHTAVMNCRAIGSPAPKIHWLKDMKRVDILSTSRYTLLDGEFFFNKVSKYIFEIFFEESRIEILKYFFYCYNLTILNHSYHTYFSCRVDF